MVQLVPREGYPGGNYQEEVERFGSVRRIPKLEGQPESGHLEGTILVCHQVRKRIHRKQIDTPGKKGGEGYGIWIAPAAPSTPVCPIALMHSHQVVM